MKTLTGASASSAGSERSAPRFALGPEGAAPDMTRRLQAWPVRRILVRLLWEKIMNLLKALPRAAGVVVASLLVAACTSPESMSPKQKEAYELRRYCEQNPNDVTKCIGYLGDH
jgi:hypothetical protein